MLGHRHNHGPRLRAGCQLCEQGPAPAPAPAPSRPGAGPPGGASRAPPLPLGGCCAAPPGTGTVEPGRRPGAAGRGSGGCGCPVPGAGRGGGAEGGASWARSRIPRRGGSCAQPGWPRAMQRRSSGAPERIKTRGSAAAGGSLQLRGEAAESGEGPGRGGGGGPELRRRSAAARPGPAVDEALSAGSLSPQPPAPCPPRCPACWPGWRCCCSPGPPRPTAAAARPSTRSRLSATPM